MKTRISIAFLALFLVGSTMGYSDIFDTRVQRVEPMCWMKDC